jgi:oligosaccharide reducing-end xylanase
MKKFLLFGGLVFVGFQGYSQKPVVAKPYEIGAWEDFRESAITYTFDDNLPNQYTTAVPDFDELGYKATFYSIIDSVKDWAKLKTMAANGHEIGSHTVKHASLGGLNDSLQTIELKTSQDIINKNVDNAKCVTLAYPYCVTSNKLITSKYYISARICSGQIESKTPADFMNISSLICGSLGGTKTVADFKSRINTTVAQKGWCVFLIHELDKGAGYSPLSSSVLKSSLYYCKIRNYKVWVSTFANVSKYIRERNASSVSEVSLADTITLKVTDTLDNNIFDYPITIRRPLPAGWKAAAIVQNGKELKSMYVKIDTTVYIMFNVIPDAGDIKLTKQSVAIELIDQKIEDTDTIYVAPVVKPSTIKTSRNDEVKLSCVSGNLKFELPADSGDDVQINIYSATGELLANYKLHHVIDGKGNIQLPKQNVKSGIFIVNLSDGKSTWNKSIISM